MQNIEKSFTRNLSSFDQMEGPALARGMNDWAVPWADLMMVMFVLFVVLFIYASTHQDVKVLFSQNSAEKAQASSTLDPLIGLIGQISSRVDPHAGQDVVRVAGQQVLYRSRSDGVSVVREGPGRVRVSLRGELFFGEGQGDLASGAEQYLQEVAEVIRLSVGTVHVVGYSASNEVQGTESFTLSTSRAADVGEYLISQFGIDPKRVIITGRGGYHPELPGTSPANLAMNRRVEIIITNEI